MRRAGGPACPQRAGTKRPNRPCLRATQRFALGAAKAAAAAEKERLAAEAKKPGTVSQPKYYGNIRGIAQPATYGVGAPKK